MRKILLFILFSFCFAQAAEWNFADKEETLTGKQYVLAYVGSDNIEGDSFDEKRGLLAFSKDHELIQVHFDTRLGRINVGENANKLLLVIDGGDIIEVAIPFRGSSKRYIDITKTNQPELYEKLINATEIRARSYDSMDDDITFIFKLDKSIKDSFL